MVARQFLRHRRTDSNGAAASAALVQPGAAAPGEWPGGGISSGVWHRAAIDLARGRRRQRDQRTAVYRGISNRDAADVGRAVGGADHAATGAAGKLAARGGAPGRRTT